MIHEWRTRLQAALDHTLLLAVCDEHVGRTRALLMLGANPNAVGWCVCGLVTPLEAARVRQAPALITLLLAHGAEDEESPEPTLTQDPCAPHGDG